MSLHCFPFTYARSEQMFPTGCLEYTWVVRNAVREDQRPPVIGQDVGRYCISDAFELRNMIYRPSTQK